MVIVDNASTDLTPNLLLHLQKIGEPIKIVRNEENKDYVLSTNQIWKTVETPYVLLLNNDTQVKRDCVKDLLETFEKDSKIGMVSGVGINLNGSDMLPPLWYINRNTVDVERKTILDKPAEYIEVDIAQVACSIIKKEVWEKIGFYDEQFSPSQFEQEDYSLRVKEAGYKIVIVPKAKFVHFLGTSTTRDYTYYSKVLNVNREKFRAKWGEKLWKNQI